MNFGTWNCKFSLGHTHTKDNLGKWRHLPMRFSHFACLVISLMLLSPISSASELVGGQDENPTPDEVPFTIVARDAPSIDGETWALTLEMNEEEHANGTVFEITTQICTNDGVCDPPESRELVDGEEAGTFSSSVVTKDDHSYVNWRLRVTYPDSEEIEKLPSEGFYKSWSDCWHYEGEWGGDGCNKLSEEESSLPAISAALGIITITAAAITRRQ